MQELIKFLNKYLKILNIESKKANIDLEIALITESNVVDDNRDGLEKSSLLKNSYFIE